MNKLPLECLWLCDGRVFTVFWATSGGMLMSLVERNIGVFCLRSFARLPLEVQMNVLTIQL